jgi:uncharacterized protein (DUF1330 family)
VNVLKIQNRHCDRLAFAYVRKPTLSGDSRNNPADHVFILWGQSVSTSKQRDGHRFSPEMRFSMSALMIAIKERTHDPKAMEEYYKALGPTIVGLGVEVLADYGDEVFLEGPQGEAALVLRFPSKEIALKWVKSPEYQTAAAIRRAGLDFRLILVEELDEPRSFPSTPQCKSSQQLEVFAEDSRCCDPT